MREADSVPDISIPADPAQLVRKLLDTGLVLSEVERRLIIAALERNNGNQTRAARTLGLTRNTLIYRMRKHGIYSQRIRSTKR